MEPARLGPPHRQDPPRHRHPRSRAACTTRPNAGPQVDDEYLFKVVDALDEVAKETGKTVPQIALNWLLQRPTVSTVVIGARNEEQLRQNLGAVGWNLTKEQIAKLDAASERAADLSLLAPARRVHRAQPAAGVSEPAR